MTPQEILSTLNRWPKKHFGQHFLTSQPVFDQIVATADLVVDDTVVEIGPGLGVLTFELLKRAKQVLAIEADPDLAEYLRRKNIPNLTVVTGDALDIDWTITLSEPYKIVANIPYSITSPLLRKILQLAHQPTKTVLLIQKEVAERLVAEPGNNDRGYLTLLVEASATARLVQTVDPEAFYPSPKVDSAVVEIVPRAQPVKDQIFWPAVEAGFRHKRQMLSNSLFDLPLSKEQVRSSIAKAGLKPSARPAELSMADWQKLSAILIKELG